MSWYQDLKQVTYSTSKVGLLLYSLSATIVAVPVETSPTRVGPPVATYAPTLGNATMAMAVAHSRSMCKTSYT